MPSMTRRKTQKEIQAEYRYRSLIEQGEKTIFQFRTPALKALWEELDGQISDGAWENTPNTGWEFWTSLQLTIGPETKIIGEVPYIKRNFGFVRALWEYMSNEYMEVVRKFEPNATERDVKNYLNEISKAMKS